MSAPMLNLLNDPRLHPRIKAEKVGMCWRLKIKVMTPYRCFFIHHALLAPLRVVLLILWLLYILFLLLGWLSVVYVLESFGFNSLLVLLLLLVLTVLVWAESRLGRFPVTTWLFGRTIQIDLYDHCIVTGNWLSGRCYPRSARPAFIATALGGNMALYAACSARLGLLLDGTRYVPLAELLEVETEFSRQVAASLNLACELSARQPGQDGNVYMQAAPPVPGAFFSKIASLFKTSPANN